MTGSRGEKNKNLIDLGMILNWIQWRDNIPGVCAMMSSSLLKLPPGPHQLIVVIYLRFPSTDEIELFIKSRSIFISYLRLYYCVQIVHYRQEYLINIIIDNRLKYLINRIIFVTLKCIKQIILSANRGIFWIDLLISENNTWNQFTEYEQMISNSFKDNYLQSNHRTITHTHTHTHTYIYIYIYIYIIWH